MFSEYASRFLQQSNANISSSQQDAPSRNSSRPQSRNPLDRRRYGQQQGRPGMNPYPQPSQSQSRFPFASRLSRTPDPAAAPLFFSTTEDFPEDDEEEEHGRDVADAWALQRSRQKFGRSNLTESSEMDDDTIEKLEVEGGQDHDRDDSNSPEVYRGRPTVGRFGMGRDLSTATSDMSTATSTRGKGRLVDVNLASTINEEPPESLATLSPDDRPAPFQTFRTQAKDTIRSSFMPLETNEEANIAMPRPHESDMRDSVPPTVILPSQDPPKLDAFWGTLFQISLFSMFAAFILIWFHTSAPSKKNPLGDTIYSALKGSTNMLLWDTTIAIIVAMIWLALLRNFVRPLVYTVLIAVPVILFAFSLYPLIASFKGTYHGNSMQDKAMRWLSFVPFLVGCVWTWQVYIGRHSFNRAVKILEFCTRILAHSPYLIWVGFGTLAIVVIWTWGWMLMFERLFLSGHFTGGGGKKWILDASSWWLGAFFILQYLWTLSVIAGIQRATTAATVSQWYFHRLVVPQPSSQAVVKASLAHATQTFLGTICLSTFLSLLVRLPLMILPGKLGSLLNMAAYWIIPSSLATLTNPLTLTYAAIHSQPLGIASREMQRVSFVSPKNPSNTMGPRNYSPRSGSILIPYRLAKLLLQATRYIMSFALGMAGWVRTAHNLKLDGAGGLRGSLYAYIVGLVAGTIGFAVLGAVENVIGAVVDGVVICWASETGGGGQTEARFCREAGALFGEEDGVNERY